MLTSLSYGNLCYQINFQINLIFKVTCEHMGTSKQLHTGWGTWRELGKILTTLLIEAYRVMNVLNLLLCFYKQNRI